MFMKGKNKFMYRLVSMVLCAVMIMVCAPLERVSAKSIPTAEVCYVGSLARDTNTSNAPKIRTKVIREVGEYVSYLKFTIREDSVVKIDSSVLNNANSKWMASVSKDGINVNAFPVRIMPNSTDSKYMVLSKGTYVLMYVSNTNNINIGSISTRVYAMPKDAAVLIQKRYDKATKKAIITIQQNVFNEKDALSAKGSAVSYCVGRVTNNTDKAWSTTKSVKKLKKNQVGRYYTNKPVTITARIKIGNSKSYLYYGTVSVIDKTAPRFVGVKNGGVYKGSVTFSVVDTQSGVLAVSLNHRGIGTKYTIKKKGTYVLRAKDKMLNLREIRFTVK